MNHDPMLDCIDAGQLGCGDIPSNGLGFHTKGSPVEYEGKYDDNRKHNNRHDGYGPHITVGNLRDKVIGHPDRETFRNDESQTTGDIGHTDSHDEGGEFDQGDDQAIG